MRPAPVAAGFHFSRPGKISRAAKSGCSAKARRDTESAMPLEVSNLTKSRREVLTKPPLLGAYVRTGRACWMCFSLISLKGGTNCRRNVQLSQCADNNEYQHVAVLWVDATW